MLPFEDKQCCQNCEHLRIDNFCLIKGKYVLSRNIGKKRECKFFILHTQIPGLEIKQNEQDRLLYILYRRNREKGDLEEIITTLDSDETK